MKLPQRKTKAGVLTLNLFYVKVLILAFVFVSCGSLKITKILLKAANRIFLTFNTINNINDLYDK